LRDRARSAVDEIAKQTGGRARGPAFDKLARLHGLAQAAGQHHHELACSEECVDVLDRAVDGANRRGQTTDARHRPPDVLAKGPDAPPGLGPDTCNREGDVEVERMVRDEQRAPCR
jgi:hypothetical protein